MMAPIVRRSLLMTVPLLTALLQTDQAHAAGPVALDNPYVRVSRDAAPCASATAPGCEDRVIVAMSDIELGFGATRRKMTRGEVAVFKAGESYQPPAGGSYFEVAIKPNHPPVKSPPEMIPPEKNVMVYEGDRFFIYEERLDPGDTRPRHSHSQRVEIRINQGPLLQQWRDGAERTSRCEFPRARDPRHEECRGHAAPELHTRVPAGTPEEREIDRFNVRLRAGRACFRGENIRRSTVVSNRECPIWTNLTGAKCEPGHIYGH